jgi:ring hydroxylating enzyme beta subunit
MATQGPAMAPAARQALWFELMQFYIREAWLLDERQFKEWLDIFTDDVLYFMPRRKNVLRRELHREVTPLGDLAILILRRQERPPSVRWRPHFLLTVIGSSACTLEVILPQTG